MSQSDASAPFHAHAYFDEGERAAAEALRTALSRRGEVIFTGRMCDRPVGPHPVPQFEVHFDASAIEALTPLFENSGLRVLVHPLTDDDLADHTLLGRWIGEPLELDLTTLDPRGHNKGVARFGITDF